MQRFETKNTEYNEKMHGQSIKQYDENKKRNYVCG